MVGIDVAKVLVFMSPFSMMIRVDNYYVLLVLAHSNIDVQSSPVMSLELKPDSTIVSIDCISL